MTVSSYMPLFPTFSAFNTRTFLSGMTIPFTVATSSRHITILSHVPLILTIEADKSLFRSRLSLPLLSLLGVVDRWVFLPVVLASPRLVLTIGLFSLLTNRRFAVGWPKITLLLIS